MTLINCVNRPGRKRPAVVFNRARGLGVLLLAASCLPLSALAGNPFAGGYGGPSYVTYSGTVNIPETQSGYLSLNIDHFGRITGALNGTVDGNGNIAWTTPNSLYATNGLITNGVITAVGGYTSSGLTLTYRLAAAFSVGELVGAEKLTWRAPSTSASYLNAVTYGNGLFVAVGYAGVVASSPDGTNWSCAAVTGRKELSDVAFGNGLFVAVGTNWVMTSATGTNWELSATNYAFSSVAFGSGQFLALQPGGSVFASADGVNWTPVAGAASGQNFTGVDFANGQFILFGSTGRFQTSADGISWNSVRTNGTTALTGAAYAAGRWVIGGNSRVVTFSNPTGSDQAATNLTTGFNLISVAGGNNLFVAATSYAYPPAYSTNGLNWTFASGLQDFLRSVAVGTNGVFVAVGNYIQSSTDGRAWTIRSATLPVMVANNVAGTAFGNYNDQAAFKDTLNRRREVRVGLGGLIETRFLDGTNGVTDFVAVPSPTTNTLRRILGAIPPLIVGDRGTILQYDATNDSWAKVPSPTTADLYDAVNYAQSSYVAVGSGGTIIRASDYYGTNWAVIGNGIGQNLYTVFNNANVFLAGGDNGTLLISTDYGATWSSRTTGVTNRLVRTSTGLHGDGLFAFPDVGQYFLVSTNCGGTWAKVVLGEPFRMNNAGRMENGFNYDVQSGLYNNVFISGFYGPGGYYQPQALPAIRSAAYGNGRFVLLAGTNTVVSTDGVNWLGGHTEPAYRYGYQSTRVLAYGQGLFVAVGAYGVVETSPDGINWTIRQSGLTNIDFNAIAYGNGRFVGVGSAGMVYSSTNGITWEDYSFANAGGTLNAVAYGAGRFVAIGFSLGGNFISRTSTNGVNWVSGTAPTDITTLAFVNDRFIATGTKFPVYVSTNGLSWTQGQSQVLNANGNAIAYAGGRYVVVGDRTTYGDGGVFQSSLDTTNWYVETVAASGNLRVAIAANGKLIVAGDNGILLSSTYVETNAPALITGQPTPASQTVNGGATVSYTVSATGAGPLNYRWLKDGAILFDGGGISGAASPTLTLTGVDAAASGVYQLSVANNYGNDLSQPASLTVAGAPVITLQPQSTVVTNTGFTNLTVSATGGGSLSFQWYFNARLLTNAAGTLLGANANTLLFHPALIASEGDYYLVVSNNFGAATSSIAHLTVLRGPTIAKLPVTVSPAPPTNFLSPLLVFPGQSLSFGSVVDGTPPLAYQWRLNNVNLAGATNSILNVPEIQGGGSVSYSLVVTNAYGSSVMSTQFTIITGGTLRPDVAFTNVRPILDVAALPDGNYLAAGWFENSTGAKLYKFNLENLSGGYVTNLLPVGDYDPGLRTIGVLSDNSVVVGGTFYATGTPVSYSNLVRFLPNGQLDTAFRPANIGTIQKVIPLTGGKFLALQAPDVASYGFIRRYNADGSVDGSFSQLASDPAGYWGLAMQSDGSIWYGANIYGLRKANADGTGITVVDASSPTFKVFAGPDDRIYYSPSSGNLSLRRRNADGSTNAFSVAANNSILSCAFLPGGKILIGGTFTTVNTSNMNYLALLNDDGSLAAGFSSPFAVLGGGAVNSIRLLKDGSALLGTSAFNGVRRVQVYMPDLAIQLQPGSQTVNRGATVSFSTFASGSSAITYQWRKNGNAIPGATGATLTLTNVPDAAAANYEVVASNASGSSTSSIATLTILGDVQITQQPIGQAVLYGGTTNFTVSASGGIPIAFQWRRNGTNLAGATSSVLAVANATLGDIGLYDVTAANSFSSITSAPAALSVYASTNGIGGPAGTIDPSFQPSITNNGTVSIVTLALDANYKVLVTGSFTNFAGQPRRSFARLNTDLTLDTPAPVCDSSPVTALGLPDGGFALGGYFSKVNLSTRPGLAFFDQSGVPLAQPILNANGYVDGGYSKAGFAVQLDGKILIGGYFTTANSTPRTNLARLNGDGSLDTSFVPAALGVNQTVTAVAVQPDGRILVGGYFTSIGGVSQGAVARLNTNGTFDATFTNSFTFNSPYGFKFQSNGKIVVYGYGLTTIGGQSRYGLARLNLDGSLDASFNANLGGVRKDVFDLIVEADDKLVIVGAFDTVGGVSRKCVARLNPDGTLDASFATGSGASDGASQAYVYSVVKLTDGAYLIGGSFGAYDGVNRRGMARLNTTPQPPPSRAILQQPLSLTLAAGTTASFTVAATGSGPISFQWRKNTNPIPGATGASLLLTNVQSSDAAAYDVVVTDSAGSTTSQSASLTVQSASGFASWTASHNLMPGQDGPGDDPDHDGLVNLVEFALGTDPNLAGSSQAPTFVSQIIGGIAYPAIQFTRNRSATGITIQAVASTSVSFAALTPTVESSVDLGNGLDLVTVRTTSPMTANPEMFLKVNVSQP